MCQKECHASNLHTNPWLSLFLCILSFFFMIDSLASHQNVQIEIQRSETNCCAEKCTALHMRYSPAIFYSSPYRALVYVQALLIPSPL